VLFEYPSDPFKNVTSPGFKIFVPTFVLFSINQLISKKFVKPPLNARIPVPPLLVVQKAESAVITEPPFSVQVNDPASPVGLPPLKGVGSSFFEQEIIVSVVIAIKKTALIVDFL